MHRLTSLLIGFALLLTVGCTQNNGNIGIWFGTWQVTQIAVDGEPQKDYDNNMFFKFQANVCDIITVLPHNVYYQHFAEFTEVDSKTIIVDFSHTDEWNPVEFDAPLSSFLENGKNILKVTKHNNRKLTLTLQTAEGSTVTYSLKKQ